MLAFHLEFWGILCNLILTLIFWFYAYLIKKFFLSGSSPSDIYHLDELVCAWTFILFGLLLMVGSLFPTSFDPFFYYPLNFYAIFFCGAVWSVMLCSYWILKVYYNKKQINIVNFYDQCRHQAESTKKLIIFGYNTGIPLFEINRKVVHAVATAVILSFFIGPYLFASVLQTAYLPYPDTYSEPIINNIALLSNLNQLNLSFIANLQTFILVLVGSLFVQTTIEILEKIFPNLPFLLHLEVLKTRRMKEQGHIGHHVFLMLGFLASTVIIFYDIPDLYLLTGISAIFAIIMSASFADLAAAIVGLQFGVRKWDSNKNKSIIGTVAGCIVTLFTTVWFVGMFLALIAIAIFIFTDLYLPKIHLCDNFWYPVLLAIVLRLLFTLISPLV